MWFLSPSEVLHLPVNFVFAVTVNKDKIYIKVVSYFASYNDFKKKSVRRIISNTKIILEKPASYIDSIKPKIINLIAEFTLNKDV